MVGLMRPASSKERSARSGGDEPRGVGPRRIHFGGAGRRVPARGTETRLLQGTQRLRRRELHARPSAHEADELLLLHSAVETDENRTRIVRVQTGCSPVELQPRCFRDHCFGLVSCGYRESHPDLEPGKLAFCY